MNNPYDDIFVNNPQNSTVSYSTPRNPKSGAKPEPVQSSQQSDRAASIRCIIQSSSARACFGGYLFHDIGTYSQSIIRFVTEGMSSNEIAQAEEAYRYFTAMAMRSVNFLGLHSVEVIEPYTMFNFYILESQVSLRDYLQNQNATRMNPEVMMQKLVAILIDYNKCAMADRRPYTALNCLSLDTIFIDKSEKVSVLPLRAFRDRYPIEIHREVEISGGNVKSDLFSAARVAVEVFSGGAVGEVAQIEPKSVAVLNCLKIDNDWRPDLLEVTNMLAASANTGSTSPRRTSTGNSIGKKAKKMQFSKIGKNAKNFANDFFNKYFHGPEERETEAQTNGTAKPGQGGSNADHVKKHTTNGTFTEGL